MDDHQVRPNLCKGRQTLCVRFPLSLSVSVSFSFLFSGTFNLLATNRIVLQRDRSDKGGVLIVYKDTSFHKVSFHQDQGTFMVISLDVRV